MGVVSVYASDDEVISSLRMFFSRDEQYRINFRHWLNTAKKVPEGVLVQVENRKFLIHPFLGVVIREVV